MDTTLRNAFVSGLERIAAWSDLLDDINVFPVADGDTGCNLLASLSPLREMGGKREETVYKLLLSARGNSGNIATQFFSGLLTANTFDQLAPAVKLGRDNAWEAVHDPRPGTMLTVFDSFADFFEKERVERRDETISRLITHLEHSVKSTPRLLPLLNHAGVVDSGALGMYIFLESFLCRLINKEEYLTPVTTRFKGLLEVSPAFQEGITTGYCVDTVLRVTDEVKNDPSLLNDFGDQAVVISHENLLKVHIHTDNRDRLKEKFESIGEIVRWADDNLTSQIEEKKKRGKRRSIHVMSDAAGSITKDDSRKLGMTLLNSYINVQNQSLPETLFSPEKLYQAMRGGIKVSTSQASLFERHQYYRRVLEQYDSVIYLCVGSVYTGNFDIAAEWKEKNDLEGRFTIIDSGAASGKLGLAAIATARYASQTGNPRKVARFAKLAIETCEEYVFLDKLHYLAKGGRMSKKGAFFGDVLRIKPVVTPTAVGVIKVATVRSDEAKIDLALRKLADSLSTDSAPLIMLEYSDNRVWVDNSIKPRIEARYPNAEILLQPLSLTSGVHMGPGTWAIAFLPETTCSTLSSSTTVRQL